jgi:transcriptional regulator with XRE-family HTH domain
MILQLRTNLGMTQAELSRASGVGEDTLSRLESGESNIPLCLTVIKAFRVLGVYLEVT